MKIRNTTTNRIVTLEYWKSGQNMASEIMGQYDDPEITWDEEEEEYQGDDGAIAWWKNYFANLDTIDDMVETAYYADEKPISLHEFVNDFWALMPTDPDLHTPGQAQIYLD